jgi:hypothetical protein
MCRRTARLTVTLLVLTAAASAAWAAGSAPKHGGYYASSSPPVSVSVSKSGTSVLLYTACRTSPSVAEYWYSPKLPLTHGAFKFDKKTSVSTENGTSFGTTKATVLFTGKFSRSAFTGSVEIVGSACAKRSYKAKYDKSGGGSGK